MFHYLHDSTRADGNLAEVARQLGKMVEHPNQSQLNPAVHDQMGHPAEERHLNKKPLFLSNLLSGTESFKKYMLIQLKRILETLPEAPSASW